MANIFLDANYLIGLYAKRRTISFKEIQSYTPVISALSVHILLYVLKQAVPYKKFDQFLDRFIICPLDSLMLYKALNGPTKDFEDNIQLHSGIYTKCEYFLTLDQELLAMGYFGAMRICSSLARLEKT